LKGKGFKMKEATVTDFCEITIDGVKMPVNSIANKKTVIQITINGIEVLISQKDWEVLYEDMLK